MCLSVIGITQKPSTNIDAFFGRVGWVTSNNWLDFADELDHGTDAGISKEFFTLRDRTIRNLMITRRIFFMNFWGAGRLGGNETFDFISVLIRITNRIQEFLNRILKNHFGIVVPSTLQHQQHWPRFSLSERCCFFIYVAVDGSLCKGHRSSMTFVTSKMSACITLLSDLCVTFWLRRPDNNTTKTIMCAWLLTVMPGQWSSSIMSRKQVFRPPFSQMVHFYRPSACSACTSRHCCGKSIGLLVCLSLQYWHCV